MGSLALAKEFKNRNKIIAHNKTHLLCARLGLLLNDRTVTVCKNVALRRRDIFSWGSLGDCRPRNRQPLQTHAYLRLHSSPGFLCVFFCIVFFCFSRYSVHSLLATFPLISIFGDFYFFSLVFVLYPAALLTILLLLARNVLQHSMCVVVLCAPATQAIRSIK